MSSCLLTKLRHQFLIKNVAVLIQQFANIKKETSAL